jgi:ABC-type uncharacterized transport system YnjBCD permease subunit
MWVFAIIAIAISALILVIVMLLIGPVVGPLYDVVVNDPAVQEMGYDVGAEVAMRIGAQFVLPLLALSLVIWFLVMRLASDQYQGVNRR